MVGGSRSGTAFALKLSTVNSIRIGIMKIKRMGVLCALLLAVGAITVRGQAFPARIKLTCIATNSSGLVKTQITEKSIVARCASDNNLDPSRLKLFLVYGDLAIIDLVTSNMVCPFAVTDTDVLTNVAVFAFSGNDSNNVKAASFTSFKSPGQGMLPADFVGTLCSTYSGSMFTNALPNVTLKGTIQGGSVSNNAVYMGTLSIGGKAFGLPPS
jgi:hypothetical protein